MPAGLKATPRRFAGLSSLLFSTVLLLYIFSVLAAAADGVCESSDSTCGESSDDDSAFVQLKKKKTVQAPTESPGTASKLVPQPLLYETIMPGQLNATTQLRTYYFRANESRFGTNGDETPLVVNFGLVIPLPNGPSSVGLGITLEQMYTDAIARWFVNRGGLSIPGQTGLFGIKIWVVSFPTINTGYNEIELAKEAERWLISDEFPTFIHFMLSGPTTTYGFGPLIDVMNEQTDPLKQKVIITGASGVTDKIAEYDRAFSFLGPASGYFTAGLDLLVEKGARTFFLITDGDHFPDIACEGVRTYQAESQSFTVVNHEDFLLRPSTANPANMPQAIQEASNSSADVAILCTQHVTICAKFLEDARSANYQPNAMILLFCGGNPQFEGLVASNGNQRFVTVASQWFAAQPGRGAPDGPVGDIDSREWADNFISGYQYSPPYMGPAAYVGMSILLEVIQTVGLDYADITEAMYQRNERTFYANIVYNLTSPLPGKTRVGQPNIYGLTGQYDQNNVLQMSATFDPVITEGVDPSLFCYPKPAWGCSSCSCN